MFVELGHTSGTGKARYTNFPFTKRLRGGTVLTAFECVNASEQLLLGAGTKVVIIFTDMYVHTIHQLLQDVEVSVLLQVKSWDIAHDLVNSSSTEGSWFKELTELIADLANYLSEFESCCNIADKPILSLEKQVASLLSGCEELKNVESEIHIKCVHYLAIDGWSSPEEFSVTSKETRQLSITHPQPGMEILNSSVGYLSNDSDVVHVDDEPFKNLPKGSLCLRCTDYLKLSKSTEQDTQKPKLHVLFDGLKVYRRIIPLQLHRVTNLKLLYLSWGGQLSQLPVSTREIDTNRLPELPLKSSVFSWCREFIVEEHHARMLREVLPPSPKVRITTFRR